MNKQEKSVREVFAGEEILIADLYLLLKKRRKYLITSILFFFLISIAVVLTSSPEYEARAQILSEDVDKNANLSGLSGLAGLAGINLGSEESVNQLPPDMYPAIIESHPFLRDLMQERFFFQEKQKEMSLYEYLSEEKPGHIFTKTFQFVGSLPSRLFSLFEKKKEWDLVVPPAQSDSSDALSPSAQKIVHITKNEEYVMKSVASRITIEASGRMITLTVKMPEPLVSAQLNNVVREKIIKYVVDYKTDKQKANLAFVEERAKEAEEKFRQSQFRLAAFRDQNQGIVTQTVRTKEDQYQAEYNVAFNLYNKLALDLEQTRIQLKKETPLFTDFAPVTVPLTAAEPVIPVVIAIYIALGIFVGTITIIISLMRQYLREIRQYNNSTSDYL